MKYLIFAAYIFTGIGVSASSTRQEDNATAFTVKATFWPVIAGCAVSENRKTDRITRELYHKIIASMKD